MSSTLLDAGRTTGRILTAAAIASLLFTTGSLPARPPGGNGNGNGGGGGGGSEPPSDPAIVYLSHPRNDLMVMNADGSNQAKLISRIGWTQPTMSADGSLIAFAKTIDGIDGVWTIRSDGSGLRLVTPTLSRSPEIIRPAISPVPAPDGQYKIAFNDRLLDDPNRDDIWLVNLDGTGLQNLTDSAGPSETDPAWSIDATRLAIDKDPPLPPDGSRPDPGPLTILDLALVDGQIQVVNETNISHIPGSPLNTSRDINRPSWANTQDLIVVEVWFGGDDDPQLWLIDPADPTAAEQLTFYGSPTRWASFSPDDSLIIHSYQQSIYQLDAGLNDILITGRAWRPNMKRFASP